MRSIFPQPDRTAAGRASIRTGCDERNHAARSDAFREPAAVGSLEGDQSFCTSATDFTLHGEPVPHQGRNIAESAASNHRGPEILLARLRPPITSRTRSGTQFGALSFRSLETEEAKNSSWVPNFQLVGVRSFYRRRLPIPRVGSRPRYPRRTPSDETPENRNPLSDPVERFAGRTGNPAENWARGIIPAIGAGTNAASLVIASQRNRCTEEGIR